MSAKQDACYRGGNQHKFSPRYSTTSSPVSSNLTLKGSITEDILKALTKQTSVYVGDVCEWCGKSVDARKRSWFGL